MKYSTTIIKVKPFNLRERDNISLSKVYVRMEPNTFSTTVEPLYDTGYHWDQQTFNLKKYQNRTRKVSVVVRCPFIRVPLYSEKMTASTKWLVSFCNVNLYIYVEYVFLQALYKHFIAVSLSKCYDISTYHYY